MVPASNPSLLTEKALPIICFYSECTVLGLRPTQVRDSAQKWSVDDSEIRHLFDDFCLADPCLFSALLYYPSCTILPVLILLLQ